MSSASSMLPTYLRQMPKNLPENLLNSSVCAFEFRFRHPLTISSKLADLFIFNLIRKSIQCNDVN